MLKLRRARSNTPYLPALAVVVIFFAAVLQARTAAAVSPVLSYALTATSDPVAPLGAAVFTLTVTNPTTVGQSFDYCYVVPGFTQSGSNAAGTKVCQGNFGLSAGTSTSFIIDLTLLSGASTINLTVTDTLNAASVSRSVTVQSAPEAGLALSIPDGTFVPKESFTTTLTYHNYSAATLSGLQLSAPLPAGASFVSADGGGVLGSDGVVRWSPGPLAASATGAVHLNLQVGLIAPATGGLLVVDAALNDSSNDPLADASEALPVYATPVLSYGLTTMSNPVGPGQAGGVHLDGDQPHHRRPIV